jgi:hypothetical protein
MDLSEDSQSSIRHVPRRLEGSETYEADSYFDCLIRRLVHCRERVCDARHCILASCRFIHESEIFSRKHASSVLRQHPVRPPRTSLSNPHAFLRSPRACSSRCPRDGLLASTIASGGCRGAAGWRMPKYCCSFAAARIHSSLAVSLLRAMCMRKQASSGRTPSSHTCVFTTAGEYLRRSLPTRIHDQW